MGIHERTPRPKRLSSLARVWATYAPAKVAVDRQRQGWRHTSHRSVLDAEGAHVHHQLRVGGLGTTRAYPIATPSTRRSASCRVVIRHMDLPNTHILEFCRDIGCSLEFGSHRAYCGTPGKSREGPEAGEEEEETAAHTL